jgi:hypothetical protein
MNSTRIGAENRGKNVQRRHPSGEKPGNRVWEAWRTVWMKNGDLWPCGGKRR